MIAKSMVRFYAVTFNKISALFNEIYIDIRSKSETHKLIKDWIHKHRPGAGFLSHIILHFPTTFGRAGPLLLPKGRELENQKIIIKISFIRSVKKWSD